VPEAAPITLVAWNDIEGSGFRNAEFMKMFEGTLSK
jgi:hypothetical protein